jgi:SAM-dependent methyltransferase
LGQPLTAEDKRRILELYEGRLAQFGHDVRTVGWGSKQDQQLRFSALCRDLDFEKRRVLDVGCGLGDLVAFMDERAIRDYDYVGIDISAKLIQEAAKRFGGDKRRFVVADLLDGPELGEFDIVVSSGALSFRVADNLALAKQMIAKMFASSRHAVAVNFLSTYVDYQLPKNFHYEPGTMFSYARSLTRWVRLYHDYPLYEFTLHLIHDSSSHPPGRKP